MTQKEFIKVTEAFLERLEDAMAIAGCNDLSKNEFPKSIYEEYSTDSELFNDWKELLLEKINIIK
ncbi:hypothetical protein KY314_00300 [Candidatus Woesearchaeota archaeon]|nr:hypothetical protein [Candidatus Woesearchaeota archaeon]